jgi:glycogen operon protein
MPHADYAREWTVELDTNDPVGEGGQVVNAEERIVVPPRSLLVLRKTL